jgi:hypothetical protein
MFLKLRIKSWDALIALITALSFIALISIASTHLHVTAQETIDCSFCSVASDKTGGDLANVSLAVAGFFILFLTAAPRLRSACYASIQLFPPSCGPPIRFS